MKKNPGMKRFHSTGTENTEEQEGWIVLSSTVQIPGEKRICVDRLHTSAETVNSGGEYSWPCVRSGVRTVQARIQTWALAHFQLMCCCERNGFVPFAEMR